jgi:hypothetical protein
MKNSKVVFTFLPAVILLMLLYFLSIGFSLEKNLQPSNEIKNSDQLKDSKSSNTSTLRVTATGCEGPWYVCVNSNIATGHENSPFDVQIPCDRVSTICVYTTGSPHCYGSTMIDEGECNIIIPVTINLSPFNPSCGCMEIN